MANVDPLELNKSTVLVTGADSMIGRAVCKSLTKRGAMVVSAPHEKCDLMNINNLRTSFGDIDIDYAVLCAGYNGNIQFNDKYPADIYFRTAMIGLNSLKFCQERGVKKVVSVISSCAYADQGADKLFETEFWEGLPNRSIECHGLSKRVLDGYGRQLSKQHSINCISVVVNNSYGPYDSFDVNKTKVIGGLIKRFSDAKRDGLQSVLCWGTGVARRSFIYSEDAGEGIVLSLQKYSDSNQVINIGRSDDISIKGLSKKIAKFVGYEGRIDWDTTKSDGQLLKTLSTDKMKRVLGWTPSVDLDTGLSKTVSWYNTKQIEDCK